MNNNIGISSEEEFFNHVLALTGYLKSLKEEFDKYEINLSEENKKTLFLEKQKSEVFGMLDHHFDVLWNDFKNFSKEEFKEHKEIYVNELMAFIGDGIETNTYIRMKPLGYAGDYVMMNYIYDYHSNQYLGNTLYSKLINKYTCNIDVANSNIFRKEYLKSKILKCNFSLKGANILSVGCGPAREIIELLKSNKLIGPITFHLLDLEKEAIHFVKNEFDKINYDKESIIIKFYTMNLLDIVKSKLVRESFKNMDLVYVSGVFDYLSNRLSFKVIKSMYDLTKKELIVFNMSLENARHRAYYEIFGEWEMIHRTKEEILAWTTTFGSNTKVNIHSYSECKSYWILEVEK